jgi:hypothetical protein
MAPVVINDFTGRRIVQVKVKPARYGAELNCKQQCARYEQPLESCNRGVYSCMQAHVWMHTDDAAVYILENS